MSESQNPTVALLKNPVMFLALGFGSGLSPKAPGTAGSAVALLLMPLLNMLPAWWYGLMIVLAFWAGTAICNYADSRLTGKDHSSIVWDEFVGLWLALASVPATWTWWLGGFLLFRVFDILKPWPISVLDKKIPGGFGIMFDDLVAGAMVWVAMSVLVLVL
jgi:phosphatidylglycerophosphatase A